MYDLGEPASDSNPFPVSVKVDISDPRLEEASRIPPDTRVIQKFGHNLDIASGTTEIVAAQGGAAYPFLTVADNIRVAAGGDAADDSTGVGARTIMVEGLDSSFNEISVILTTNGISVSTESAEELIRVDRAWVLTSGTYGGANVADITIESAGGSELARIIATKGQTAQAVYTIPKGYNAFVRQIQAQVEGGKPASVDFWCRNDADVVAAPFTASRIFYVVARLDGHFTAAFTSYPGPFPEKTDVYVTASAVSGTAPAVSASFDLVLVRTPVD